MYQKIFFNLVFLLIAGPSFSAYNQVIHCQQTVRGQHGFFSTSGKDLNQVIKTYSDQGYKVEVQDLKLVSAGAGMGFSHKAHQGQTSQTYQVTIVSEKCVLLKLNKEN
jgi:hypothetical protein